MSQQQDDEDFEIQYQKLLDYRKDFAKVTQIVSAIFDVKKIHLDDDTNEVFVKVYIYEIPLEKLIELQETNIAKDIAVCGSGDSELAISFVLTS